MSNQGAPRSSRNFIEEMNDWMKGRDLPVATDMPKTCTKCQDTKPADDFSYNKNLPGGRLNQCRTCMGKYHREHRLKKPRALLLWAARQRANKFGRTFDLTLDDIPAIPDVCPVLGIPLILAEGGATDNSPSLDRIRNDIGYVAGNICIISNFANRIKSNCEDPRVFERIAAYLRNPPISNVLHS